MGEDFVGYISQLKVVNGILTREEVMTLYNNPYASLNFNLRYLWSEYQLNSRVRFIYPSSVKQNRTMCHGGKYDNDCEDEPGTYSLILFRNISLSLLPPLDLFLFVFFPLFSVLFLTVEYPENTFLVLYFCVLHVIIYFISSFKIFEILTHSILNCKQLYTIQG